jgi:ArsR family transcriptional regulator, lead/cadmium/zinc/bismuth-responsive transcriptional repressor
VEEISESQCSPEDHLRSKRSVSAVSPEALETAARLFRAVGDAPRLRLLALLGQGEVCVTELAQAEGEKISTISQRLRVLRSEHLVVRKRRGKHINYGLADQHVIDLVFSALAHASEVSANQAPVNLNTQGELK